MPFRDWYCTCPAGKMQQEIFRKYRKPLQYKEKNFAGQQ